MAFLVLVLLGLIIGVCTVCHQRRRGMMIVFLVAVFLISAAAGVLAVSP